MISILHGDNILASRHLLQSRIKDFKSKQFEELKLEGKEINLTDLIQAIESKSLLSQNKFLVIENFFSNPSISLKKQFLEYFFKNKPVIEIILWEGKLLSGETQKKWSKVAKLLEFKISTAIFKFVDSIKPNNAKVMLACLNECLKNEEAELIFYMMVRQLRLLILAKDGVNNLSTMPEWMRGKFLRQSQSFTKEELMEIYKKLLEIDAGQKTGKAVVPLRTELDFLLSSL